MPPERLCSRRRCRRSGYAAAVDVVGAAMQRLPEVRCSGRDVAGAAMQRASMPTVVDELHHSKSSTDRAPTQRRRVRQSSIAAPVELQRNTDASGEASLQLRRGFTAASSLLPAAPRCSISTLTVLPNSFKAVSPELQSPRRPISMDIIAAARAPLHLRAARRIEPPLHHGCPLLQRPASGCPSTAQRLQQQQ